MLALLVGAFGLSACNPLPVNSTLMLHVTDTATSAAAANVTVTVFPAADTSAPAAASGITDDGGEVYFTSDALATGDYVVRFGSATFIDNGAEVPGSDNARWWNGSDVADAATSRTGAAVIHVGTAAADLTASYAVPRGHLDDYIWGPEGNINLSGVTVTAYAWPSGKAVATVTSNSSRFYEFDDLPAQNYKLGFAKSGYATVFAGVSHDSSDASLARSLADAAEIPATRLGYGDPNYAHHMTPESTISGTVTDGTNPVPGILVVAFTADTLQPFTGTISATDGTFSIDALSAIGYKLMFVDTKGRYSWTIHGTSSLDLASGTTTTPPAAGDGSIGSHSMVGTDCAAARAGSLSASSGVDLHNCDLTGTNVDFSNLYSSDVRGANFTSASFIAMSSGNLRWDAKTVLPAGWKIIDATFVGPGAQLSGINLSGADLSGMSLNGASIDHVDVTGTNLTGVDLSHVSSGNVMSNAQTVVPAGWKIAGGAFVGRTALLYDVNLSGVDLSGMDLSGIRLTRVDLSGTDLSGATLTGVDSSGLVSNANTVLPDGWSIVGGTLVFTAP